MTQVDGGSCRIGERRELAIGPKQARGEGKVSMQECAVFSEGALDRPIGGCRRYDELGEEDTQKTSVPENRLHCPGESEREAGEARPAAERARLRAGVMRQALA
ncbi:hypothetical protein Dda_3784 [Drechslerella dactyloides]|uniref:Uncharacterized protein n=1 Tax=Drechslerella dactyloides TaxID=74499 RepID=A0AAD6IYJ5_DREDA|nr:hypothetical protein Dda_3784 [Drechslerella dactyloides]